MTEAVALNAPFLLVSGPDGKADGRELFSVQVDAGSVVELDFNHLPAPCWQPEDDAAREMLLRHPPVRGGTMDDLTAMGLMPRGRPAPGDAAMAGKLAEAMAQIAQLRADLAALQGSPAAAVPGTPA